MIDYQQIFNSLSIPCLLLEPVGDSFVVKDVTSGYCEIIGRKKEYLLDCLLPEIFLQDPNRPNNNLPKIIGLLEKARETGAPNSLGVLPYHIYNTVTGKIEEKFWRVENVPIYNQNEHSVKFILHTIIDKTSVVGSKEKNFSQTEELIGKYAFHHIHPEDKERVESSFEEIKGEKTLCIAPYRYADSQGNYKWFESQIRNRLKDPLFNGIVLNTREITDLVNKKKEIEELNARYRLAATASGDLIYEWNLQTNSIERFFRDNEKHFGYEKQDLQQLTQWGENIHPEEVEDLKTLLKNSLKNPSRDQIRSQYRFKRKDGTYAHVIDRARIIRDKNGVAIKLIGATIDISLIIERKDSLKIANKRFSYAMKATQEMIWDWDMVEDKIERSKAFEKLIGPLSEDLPAPDYAWYEIVDHNDQERVKASLDKALSDPKVTLWQEEYEIYPRNSKRRFVTDRAYIIRNAKGKAIRMVGATLDVTKSREMMKAIEAQNMALKQIAWEQAHIVRTPLVRIMGLLDFMDDPLNREMDQKEILQLIKDSAHELDSIVTKIVRRTENVEA